MHSEVKRLADQGDIAGLRYIFADALDVDPTFEQYQADYDYCQSKGLLEPHQEFTPLTDEPSQWTKDYWAHLKVDLLKNLSARRLTHMKKVARVLMADKVQCLTAERQAAQAKEQADEARKQAQTEHAARADQPKSKGQPTTNSPSPGSQGDDENNRVQTLRERNAAQNQKRDQSTEAANHETDRKNNAAREASSSKKWAGIAMAAAVLVVILAIILVVLSNPGQAAAILQAGTKFISAITTPIV